MAPFREGFVWNCLNKILFLLFLWWNDQANIWNSENNTILQAQNTTTILDISTLATHSVHTIHVPTSCHLYHIRALGQLADFTGDNETTLKVLSGCHSNSLSLLVWTQPYLILYYWLLNILRPVSNYVQKLFQSFVSNHVILLALNLPREI